MQTSVKIEYPHYKCDICGNHTMLSTTSAITQCRYCGVYGKLDFEKTYYL